MVSPRSQASTQARRASTVGAQPARWAAAASAALTALALVACHATTPTAGSTPQPVTTTSPQAQALRVTVKFRQPVAYSDPSFLGSLSRQVDAQISYLSSVAPDTHTYRVVPQSGQSGTAVLSRLSAQPSIAWAEEDQKARPSR